MPYTDGLIVRCSQCGAFNVVTNPISLGSILMCLNCDGEIGIHYDTIVCKQGPGLIP